MSGYFYFGFEPIYRDLWLVILVVRGLSVAKFLRFLDFGMWFVKDNGLTTDFIFFGVIWCYLHEENSSEPNESLEREMIALEFPFLFLRVDIGDGMIWFFRYNGKVFYLLMSIDLTISCLLAGVGLLFLIEIIFLALLFVLLKVLISSSSDTRIFGIIY